MCFHHWHREHNRVILHFSQRCITVKKFRFYVWKHKTVWSVKVMFLCVTGCTWKQILVPFSQLRAFTSFVKSMCSLKMLPSTENRIQILLLMCVCPKHKPRTFHSLFLTFSFWCWGRGESVCWGSFKSTILVQVYQRTIIHFLLFYKVIVEAEEMQLSVF